MQQVALTNTGTSMPRMSSFINTREMPFPFAFLFAGYLRRYSDYVLWQSRMYPDAVNRLVTIPSDTSFWPWVKLAIKNVSEIGGLPAAV